MRKIKVKLTGDLSLLVIIIFCAGVFAAWTTHIVHCLIHAKYLLLLVGAIAFPVGFVHGVSVWFGMGW